MEAELLEVENVSIQDCILSLCVVLELLVIQSFAFAIVKCHEHFAVSGKYCRIYGNKQSIIEFAKLLSSHFNQYLCKLLIPSVYSKVLFASAVVCYFLH